MKKFLMLSAVWMAGYLTGIYEMKYKLMKIWLAQTLADKEEVESK